MTTGHLTDHVCHHFQDSKAESKSDSVKADPEVGKRRCQYCRFPAPEHQPKDSDEFSSRLDKGIMVSSPSEIFVTVFDARADGICDPLLSIRRPLSTNRRMPLPACFALVRPTRPCENSAN